jgi:predicted ester cyclase
MTYNGHESVPTGDPAAPQPAPERKITLQEKRDIQYTANQRLARVSPPLPGFDPKWADFVDYIIGITHEIWEEKGIGRLYDYYANTIQIHTSSGTVHGRAQVMSDTINAMAAYPDRRLYGDEVIWGGDAVHGFYSSHRLTHSGTNRGWSLYGPPTGRKISYRAIADCLCFDNMIVEEWLIRDELTLVHQLGLDPVETAKQIARREARIPYTAITPDVERGIGQYPPAPVPQKTADGFDPEHFVRSMIHEVWNWRLLNKVRDYFAETIHLESASTRRFHGYNAYQAYILSLLSPFPDLAVDVEHFVVLGDEETGYRTATRWRMRGTHTGFGMYGEPTGNPIQILGVSHHLIHGGKVQHEWTLFDEFAILKQIHRPTTAHE